MPIRLKVRPDIAHKLAALAKAKGVSVDELLLALINCLEPAQGRGERTITGRVRTGYGCVSGRTGEYRSQV